MVNCIVCGETGLHVCDTCRADPCWAGVTDTEIVDTFAQVDRDIAVGVRRIRNGKPPMPSWTAHAYSPKSTAYIGHM